MNGSMTVWSVLNVDDDRRAGTAAHNFVSCVKLLTAPTVAQVQQAMNGELDQYS